MTKIANRYYGQEELTDPKTPATESNEGVAAAMGSPDAYDKYEPFHPGYNNMQRNVIKHILSSTPAELDEIVDIGPGTGIVTKRLAEAINGQRKAGAVAFQNIKTISAVEPAPDMAKFLERKIAQQEIENINVHTQGILNFLQEAEHDETRKIGTMFSTFTEHHIQPKEKLDVLNLIAKTLKRGAEIANTSRSNINRTMEGPAYIIGDEFLPDHTESNAWSRVEALVQYHGDVIRQGVKRGNVMLPKLELQALISGLHNVVPFLNQTGQISHQKWIDSWKQTRDNISEIDRPFEERSYLTSESNWNSGGINKLTQYIEEIEEIYEAYIHGRDDKLPYEFNPSEPSTGGEEKMSNAEFCEHFSELIDQLKELKTNLEKSPRAGLEHNENMQNYGDYKMTVRQFVDYLHDAGLQVQGYFMGPGYKGWAGRYGHCTYDTDKEDQVKSVGFHQNQRHGDNSAMGGVWVLKAVAESFKKEADVMIDQIYGNQVLMPM